MKPEDARPSAVPTAATRGTYNPQGFLSGAPKRSKSRRAVPNQVFEQRCDSD